jgi:hypothetical protein
MAGIFGGGSAAQKITRYTSVDLQTSALGVCIPLVWGRNRVGTNVIWLNGFRSKPAGKGGGKGGNKSGQYDYTTAMILALCEGPIIDVMQVWADQTITDVAALGFDLQLGGPDQVPPAWFDTDYSNQAMSYAYTAYVFSAKYDLGQSATIPNHTFEVDGLLSGTMSFSPANLPDANPADIISDYLLSTQYGLDPGATYIDATTWANYKLYCTAQSLFMSPYLRNQEQATSTLQRWAQLTNSWIFWSGTALKFIPLGMSTVTGNGVTWTPNLTPIYDLGVNDFVPSSKGDTLVTVTRIDPADGYNRVEIDNRNRNDQYNTDPTYWEDQTSVDEYGQLQSQTVTADEVCDPNVAAIMAALIGQRSVYIRNTYEWSTSNNFVLLEPGDIVALTEPAIGLNAQLVRITDVSEDDKGLLKFQAEEAPNSISTPAQVVQQTNGANGAPNFDVEPGSVNPPLIIEPPLSVTGGVPQLWIGASGGADWGGAQVWLSADNVTYVQLGEITAGTAQGVLTASLPSGSDPDTADTLAVDLTESLGVLSTAATQADADAFRTAALIDNEIVAYGTVTATGAYTADLTYLRRGVYDTAIASHASGAAFSTINPQAVFQYVLPKSYVGVELWVKLPSFNVFDNAQQELSAATAYSYTPTGVAYTIAAPTSPTLAITSTTQPDGTSILVATVTWVASAGPALASYNIEWSTNGGSTWSAPTVVGAGGLSASLSPVNAASSYIARVQAVSTNGSASAWVVSAALASNVPGAPTGLAVTPGVTTAALTWTAPSVGPVASYEIWRANGAGASFGSAAQVGTSGTASFGDTGLTALTSYTWFIVAVNSLGAGANSTGVSATTT